MWQRVHLFVARDHDAIVDVVFDCSGRAMFSFDDSVSGLLVWFLTFGIQIVNVKAQHCV